MTILDIWALVSLTGVPWMEQYLEEFDLRIEDMKTVKYHQPLRVWTQQEIYKYISSRTSCFGDKAGWKRGCLDHSDIPCGCKSSIPVWEANP